MNMKSTRYTSKWHLTAPAMLSLSILLSGCGKEAGVAELSTPEVNSNAPAEPITLTLFNDVVVAASDIDMLIVEPAKKKFPHITLNVVAPGKGTYLPDLVAAGQIPDMILGGFYNQARNDELGVVTNLDELISKAKIDMSQYPSALTETFKLYRSNWYALPLYLNIAALWYNKDIFDKFGVPYPSDGLTWQEAIELGKKLTREDGGVKYMGFYPGNWNFMAGQLAIPRVDPQTKKAVFDTPDMEKVFRTLKDGNVAAGSAEIDSGKARTMFLNERTLAMFPNWMIVGELEDLYNKQGNTFNWDMAVQPTFAGVNSQVDAHYLMIGANSKYKEQAFELIAYLSSNKESQLNVSRYGRIPALQDTELLKEFASGLNSFKGKRFYEVLSQNKMNKSHLPTKYDNTIAAKHLNAAANAVIKNGTDINTSLRDAVEAANKELAAATN